MFKAVLLRTLGFCIKAYSKEFASLESNSFAVIKDKTSGAHSIVDLSQVANFDANNIDFFSQACGDQGGDPSQTTSQKINSCVGNTDAANGCYAVLNNEMDYSGCAELKINSAGSICPVVCDYPNAVETNPLGSENPIEATIPGPRSRALVN